MNKLLFPLLYLALAAIFISSCKKESTPDNNANGPAVLLRTEGFLCTMGVARDGSIDTLTYYQTTIAKEMTVYFNAYLRDQDELHIVKNGNNTVTIKRKTPWTSSSRTYSYFGIEVNSNPPFSSFPYNDYLWDFPHESASPETEFIVKRSDADINKFTIESNVYRGYFLGTEKWRNASYPTEERLVYTTTPQDFFFMTK